MEILLGIYATTSLVSYLFVGLTQAAINKRLDREGYIDITKDYSIPEKIKETLETILILSIPVLNIVFSSYAFFSSSTYDDVLKSSLEKNLIRKKTSEELILEREEKLIKEEKKNKKDNSEKENITSRIKSYSEMTNEEKLIFLERERNFLLSQNNPQLASAKDERGAYSKKRK